MFFSDANGCVAAPAWEEVPFRDVAYAEDRLLAAELLAAGYAKVYVPDAAVVHSHDYPPVQHLRRCFDEWRALHEISGYVEPLSFVALFDAVREDGLLLAARHHATRDASAPTWARGRPACRPARARSSRSSGRA